MRTVCDELGVSVAAGDDVAGVGGADEPLAKRVCKTEPSL